MAARGESDMADTSDIMFKMIEEQRFQARQSEDQRATLTNYVVVIAAAILGFPVNRGLVKEMWPVAIRPYLPGYP